MYEKHNTQTNTIESVLNIHERYWAFFEKFPMAEYLLDFDFDKEDLKNDQTFLICTAKLIDRTDDKVLLKTVSSIDINVQHAWQYVESYAAARLFNRLGIEVKLDEKPATEEAVKALTTHPETSQTTPTQDTSDHVDLDLPEIGELIPNETSEQPSEAVEPASENSSIEPESQKASAESEQAQPEATVKTEESVDTIAEDTSSISEQSEVNEAPSMEETAQAVESDIVDEPETQSQTTDEEPLQSEPIGEESVDSTVEAESSLSEPTQDLEVQEFDTDEDVIAQAEEANAILSEQMIDELEEAEVTEVVDESNFDAELEQAMPESDGNLNEADLEDVSIALPTADMFGESPVDTSDTVTEAEVEQEQTFDMLEELDDEQPQTESTDATKAEVTQPAPQSKYDETNHPQDVPGTIWGNVVAAVKETHGNDWKAHLPTNMEEAIVVLQSS